MKSFYVLSFLLCVVLLSACGDKAARTDHRNTDKPKMEVKWEVSGNTLKVHVDTDLHISKEHYGKARTPGEGHIHMYLDDGDKVGVKENDKEFPDLDKGPHSLKVSLHNNDHTPYDVTQTFNFEIK